MTTRDPYVRAMEGMAERIRRLEAQITYIAPRVAVFIGASEFSLISGSALLEEYKYGYAWMMPRTSDNAVGAHWLTDRFVHDDEQWNFWIYYAMETATSGNVRVGNLICYAPDGSVIQSGCSGTTSTVAVPGVVHTLDTIAVSGTRTIGGRNLISIRIDRPALSDGLDTAAGRMAFLGVEIATI